MRTILTITIILLITNCFAQFKTNSTSQQIFDNIVSTINPDVISNEWVSINFPQLPIYKVNGSYCLSTVAIAHANFTSKDLQGLAYIGSETGHIITLKIPLENIADINQFKNLEYLEVASRIQPLIEDMVVDTRADSVWQGHNAIKGYTGKNVLIGITDWGFDYEHPMFMDTTLTNTRIRAAWDQFKTVGDHPTGMNYGVEYDTEAELMAAKSDTASTYYDYATHGSHVAGIAAGSGAGTVHRGVAFEAEYLFNSIQLDIGSAIDAFNWMKNIADADNKRLVINMSWGLYYIGTLDGNSTISQAIDILSNQGVLFVTSAGNNGDENFHIKKTFNQDTITTRIGFYGYHLHPAMWGQSISIWGESNHSFSTIVQVYNSSNTLLDASPVYSTSTTGYEDSILVIGSDTIFYNIEIDAAHPLNNRPFMRMRIKNTNTTYRIVLKSYADAGTVHYWNLVELSNGVGNWGLPFYSFGTYGVSGDSEYGIGEPAATASAITVAAHTPQVSSQNGTVFPGNLANFSSQGPLYNGDIKPDVSAPGNGIISSISSYTTANYNASLAVNHNGRTYHFASFSGTSMSSPATAGVAALVLEANPLLTPAEVKTVIKNSAREDVKTGVITAPGSTMWGMGKVTATNAIKLAEQTVGTYNISSEGTEFIVYPNPASDVLNISSDNDQLYSLNIYSADGKLVYSSLHNKISQINLYALSNGVYFLSLTSNTDRASKSFIINR